MQIAYTSLCLHVPTLNQITYKRWGLKTQNYYFSAYQLTGCTSCCHRNGTIQLTTPPPPTPTPAPSPPLLLLTRPGRVQGSVAVMNITPYTYHYIFNMQFFSYTAAIDIPFISKENRLVSLEIPSSYSAKAVAEMWFIWREYICV